MASHSFTFEGGEILNKMGASWFVSYAYFEKVDPSHRNWEKVSTANTRLTKYVNGRAYHRIWLQEVLAMSPNKLNKNTIGLDADQIKSMAKEILARLEAQPETGVDQTRRDKALKRFENDLQIYSKAAYRAVSNARAPDVKRNPVHQRLIDDTTDSELYVKFFASYVKDCIKQGCSQKRQVLSYAPLSEEELTSYAIEKYPFLDFHFNPRPDNAKLNAIATAHIERLLAEKRAKDSATVNQPLQEALPKAAPVADSGTPPEQPAHTESAPVTVTEAAEPVQNRFPSPLPEEPKPEPAYFDLKKAQMEAKMRRAKILRKNLLIDCICIIIIGFMVQLYGDGVEMNAFTALLVLGCFIRLGYSLLRIFSDQI